MAFLSNGLGVSGAVIQVVLLYLLLRGPLGRYFPLFLYVLSNLVSTLMEGWVIRTWGPDMAHYFPVYWGGELLLDLLLFFLVISLTVRAMEGNPLKPAVTNFLGVVLVAALVLPFLLFKGPAFQDTGWNQRVSQVLNFGAAIMNLGLWSALLVGKKRDPQLLMVSAGLGLAVAGAAVTLGVRQFTAQDSAFREIADVTHRLLHIASMLIWCWAFRLARKPRAPHALTQSPQNNGA